MNNCFKVVIWFKDKYGFIEYEAEQKNINVVLDHPVKKDEVEKYLSSAHEIRMSDQTIHDFSPATIIPQESLANFKIALTRLWSNTGVLVCWSNPV